MPEWRNLVCGVVIVILPTSLVAQDAMRGMLHSDGGTWLNEAPAPATAAIFPDSLVQTQKGHVATIDVEGSTVLIGPETMVQFQGHELVLDHGSLRLETASEMEVIVGCVSIIPTTGDRTLYQVTDVDGKVKIAASKKDVKVHSHGGALRRSKQSASSDSIVHEGQQTTREERCAAAETPSQAANGAILNKGIAEDLGIAAVAVLTCLGLCHEDNPVSPAKP